jgi:hypothetical protein
MIRKQMLLFGLTILTIVLVMSLVTCIGSAKPTPGASFSGAINIGDKASNGEIGFDISEDGTSIKNLYITLNNLNHEGFIAERVHDNRPGLLISIKGNKFTHSLPAIGSEFTNFIIGRPYDEFPTFDSLNNISQIEGKFLSSNQASGTIKIYIWVPSSDRAFELGEFLWETKTLNQ